MGIKYNTNVIRDGLVFACDEENIKSFKGKPTTNLTTDTPSQTGWMGQYVLVDSNTKTFDITTQQNISSTTSAWRTFYWAVTPGSTVTISMDVELISENNATWLHYTVGQFNEGSFPANIPGSLPNGAVQVTTRPSGKIHMTWSGVINATQPYVGITQWINNVTVDEANVVTRISNVQIEESAFETPFVNGTRSNTEAILDLQKNYTITSQSLTYNSDNTFEFNGTTDWIETSSIDLGTPNNFTVEGWVYSRRTSEARFITPFSNGIDNFINISNNDIAVVYCESADTNGRSIVSSGDKAPINQWNHFAVSIIDKTVYLWVNGELIGSQTETFFPSSWTGSWRLGQRGNNTFWLDGKIGPLRIYNRKLTDDEVAIQYEAHRGRFGL